MEETITALTEETFIQYMTSQQSYLTVIIVGIGAIVGCIIAAVILRWFHRG